MFLLILIFPSFTLASCGIDSCLQYFMLGHQNVKYLNVSFKSDKNIQNGTDVIFCDPKNKIIRIENSLSLPKRNLKPRIHGPINRIFYGQTGFLEYLHFKTHHVKCQQNLTVFCHKTDNITIGSDENVDIQLSRRISSTINCYPYRVYNELLINNQTFIDLIRFPRYSNPDYRFLVTLGPVICKFDFTPDLQCDFELKGKSETEIGLQQPNMSRISFNFFTNSEETTLFVLKSHKTKQIIRIRISEGRFLIVKNGSSEQRLIAKEYRLLIGKWNWAKLSIDSENGTMLLVVNDETFNLTDQFTQWSFLIFDSTRRKFFNGCIANLQVENDQKCLENLYYVSGLENSKYVVNGCSIINGTGNSRKIPESNQQCLIFPPKNQSIDLPPNHFLHYNGSIDFLSFEFQVMQLQQENVLLALGSGPIGKWTIFEIILRQNQLLAYLCDHLRRCKLCQFNKLEEYVSHQIELRLKEPAFIEINNNREFCLFENQNLSIRDELHELNPGHRFLFLAGSPNHMDRRKFRQYFALQNKLEKSIQFFGLIKNIQIDKRIVYGYNFKDFGIEIWDNCAEKNAFNKSCPQKCHCEPDIPCLLLTKIFPKSVVNFTIKNFCDCSAKFMFQLNKTGPTSCYFSEDCIEFSKIGYSIMVSESDLKIDNLKSIDKLWISFRLPKNQSIIYNNYTLIDIPGKLHIGLSIFGKNLSVIFRCDRNSTVLNVSIDNNLKIDFQHIVFIKRTILNKRNSRGFQYKFQFDHNYESMIGGTHDEKLSLNSKDSIIIGKCSNFYTDGLLLTSAGILLQDSEMNLQNLNLFKLLKINETKYNQNLNCGFRDFEYIMDPNQEKYRFVPRKFSSINDNSESIEIKQSEPGIRPTKLIWIITVVVMSILILVLLIFLCWIRYQEKRNLDRLNQHMEKKFTLNKEAEPTVTLAEEPADLPPKIPENNKHQNESFDPSYEEFTNYSVISKEDKKPKEPEEQNTSV